MFRVLGFEVRVRPGFVFFLGLLVFLYQNAYGIWLAGAIAVFTFLHELGHAFAARSASAEATISLDFMAGYTSFRAARPLSSAQRVLISAAGPLTQIGVSVAILFAMGINPFSIDSVRSGSMAEQAIWWAGPAIGLMNLIPVLPLDGGHLLLAALEPMLGKRAARVTTIFSMVATVAGAIALNLAGYPTFSIFVLLLLIGQFQLLDSTSDAKRRRSSAPIDRALQAERSAWETGSPGKLEPGQELSPWHRAHLAIEAGDSDGAREEILADLRSARDTIWVLPPEIPPATLRPIVDTLPHALPVGNPMSSRVLAEVLLRVGETERAGAYAATAFETTRSSSLATLVAIAAVVLGDDDNAARWLTAAGHATEHEPPAARDSLRAAMTVSPLRRLNTRPDYASVLQRL